MSGKTSIEWCDATWNPVRGCSRVSEGCRNCYAERMAARFSKAIEYGGDTFIQPFHGFATPKGWTGKVALIPELLDAPLRWKKPRRVFVNSMSDLFHEALPEEDVGRVFHVMGRARWHTFQVLTKRPARMAALMSDAAEWVALAERLMPEEWRASGNAWPPPNVHLGVSVEDQATADERIPLLLQTPAALRFVSYEPALGPVDLVRWMCFCPPRIDWLIVGGESGPGARPCDPAWIRSAKEQARAAGVPVFVKQDSGRLPGKQGRIPDDLWVREFPK